MPITLNASANRNKAAHPGRLKWVFGVECDGLRVAIKARKAENSKVVFKRFGGWWNQNIKAWMFTCDDAKKLASHLSSNPEAIQTTADTKGAHKFIYWGANQNIKLGCFSSLLDVRLFNINNKGTVLLSTSYDRIIANKLTRVLGGYWNEEHDAYVFKGKSQDDLLNGLAEHCFVYPDEVYVNKNVFSSLNIPAWRDLPRERLVFGAETALMPEELMRTEDEIDDEKDCKDLLELAQKPIEKREIPEGLLEKVETRFNLRSYQTTGVGHLLSLNSALLADDMGLGKTRQSVVAACITQKDGISVAVVPAYLRINWKREIEIVNPKATIWLYGVDTVDGKKPVIEPYLRGEKRPQWIVCSYEAMSPVTKLMDEYGWGVDTLLIDEAHYLKEMTSQRTQKGFALAQKANKTVLLTGTPTLGKISEIYTLMKLGGHPLAQTDYLTFDKTFGRSKMDRRVLNSHLTQWMLRRSKAKELNLKGKLRNRYTVDGSPAFWSKYKEIERTGEMTMLTKILRARQLLEEEKVDPAFSLIEGLQKDDKAILFLNYKETFYNAINKAKNMGIGVAGFCGDHSDDARQKAVDEFQSNPDTRLIIITIDAGYAGWTLTAANWVLFTSMPWTPSKLLQAEDRAYRLGQERLVNIGILTVADTVDDPLWTILQQKANVAAEIVEPDELFEAEKAQALDVVKTYGLSKKISYPEPRKLAVG